MGTSRHVAITGGSGFLGINLVRFLLARDWQVTILDLEPPRPEFAGNINVVVGDIRDPAAVSKAVAGASCLVHTAAALPLQSADTIHSVETGGTRTCLEISQSAGVERFIHISTTAVYGIDHEINKKEDAPLVGIGAYGQAKIEAERICSEFRSNRFAVSILRPKSFIGPERTGCI